MAQKQMEKEEKETVEIPREQYEELVVTLENIKESKEENEIRKKLKKQSEELGKIIEERGGEGGLLTREEKIEAADELLEEKGIK